MTARAPIGLSGTRFAVRLATIALAFAACSSSNAPSSSASAGSTEGAPTAPRATVADLTPTVIPEQPLITPPPPASQPETIHLILHPSTDTQVSIGSLTGCTNTTSCQGDYRIGNDPLFDAATGKQVGMLVYVEFVLITGDSLFHSPANTITLTGRGQIVFSETLYDDGSDRPATGTILGGTGEFLGVTGFVVSRSLPGKGDFVITITK